MAPIEQAENNDDGGGSQHHDAEEKIILVMGACALDRSLCVAKYPSADSKTKTTSVFESGGGNAANTASALARLAGSSFVHSKNGSGAKNGTMAHRSSSQQPSKIRVRLITKLGSDKIGDDLCQELEEYGVDIHSPLFLRVEGTSPFTTVIISDSEHTRTCFHTPGSCGEVTVEDVQGVDLDEVFRNVVHFHSDSRHTKAAVHMARAACMRGIPVTVDAERDRAQIDSLLSVADIVFTNQHQMEDYLHRQVRDHEDDVEGSPTSSPEHGFVRAARSIVLPRVVPPMTLGNTVDGPYGDFIRAARLCHHFYRRYGAPHKEVVVSRGSLGSIHVHHFEHKRRPLNLEDEDDSKVVRYDKKTDVVAVHELVWARSGDHSHKHRKSYEIREDKYRLNAIGTLKDVQVADTTGAGDCFIGAYILCLVSNGYNASEHQPVIGTGGDDAQFNVEMAMMLATWVAGKKIQRNGARSGLPSGKVVDEELGMDETEVWHSLRALVGPSRDGPS